MNNLKAKDFLDEIKTIPQVICPYCKGKVTIAKITSTVSMQTMDNIEVVGYCIGCGKQLNGVAKGLEVQHPSNNNNKTCLIVKDVRTYASGKRKISYIKNKNFNPSKRYSH